MAKPKKSKLRDVTQGQPTGKRNPRKAKIIPKVDEDAIKKMAAVATRSSSVENLGLSTPKSRTISRNSLITSSDPDAGIPAISSRSPTVISGKIRQLSLQLQDSETSIPYIYTLKKRPRDEEFPIKQVVIHSSSETEEDEEVRSADEADFADGNVRSEGEKSYLSSEDEAGVIEASDKDIRLRFDLLKTIGNFPNWDELIATSAMDSSLIEGEHGIDMGRYRNPLAGSSFSTEEEEMTVQSELDYDHFSAEEPRSATDFKATRPPVLSSSETEFSDEADSEDERPRVEVDPMPNFIPELPRSSTDSSESLHKERRQPAETYQSLEIYLYELVNKVVGRAEQGEHRLRRSLDKHKLLERLCAEVEDNHHERCNNEYLTKRLTAFHQRRFKYSLITPSTSSSINERHYRRYQGALNELDLWLNKEHEAEKVFQTERDRLERELEERQSQDGQEINRLEERITETLLNYRQLSDRLEFAMNNIFRQMRKKRDEMSETRLDLIVKQHNNSYVLQKIDETETLSEDLKMHTYLAAEVEVEKLESALSFKTAELNRLYSRIISKIHTISHLRCRRKLLSRNFRLAKDELLELKKKHFELRAETYQIHLRHNRVLARIKEVRHKGGLMHYPLLLMDYDKTNKIVIGKRKRVSLMRAHHDSLLEKIEEVELAIQQSVSSITQKD